MNALDRASRGGPIRAFLSGDDMWVKAALAVLALMGVAVAAGGVAGVVLVAAVALLAVVPASIGQGRGGRWLAWYLYGALVFPLAVGHALMLPTAEEQPGTAPGDRQLRALIGGAAALFITLGVGFTASEVSSTGQASDRAEGAGAAVELIENSHVLVREWVVEYCQGMGDKKGKSANWVQGCMQEANANPGVHNLGE